MLDEKKDLLCFSCGQMIYAVELPYVAEICFDAKLYKIPCLPEYFRGVYHYRGKILAVICMDEKSQEDTAKTRTEKVLLILKYRKYLFCIGLKEEPFLTTVSRENLAVDTLSQLSSDIWEKKDIYSKDGNLISLLDLKKIIEKLSGHQG